RIPVRMPCTMRKRSRTSRQIIYPGANRDGNLKSEDILQQLVEDVMPPFELLYPYGKAIFVFDQSGDRNAYKKNALVASKMTLKDKTAAGTSPCRVQTYLSYTTVPNK
ncbi:hypothetical protein DFQ29_003392, partial [Apophysomyces sp. BC1021]